MPDPVSGEVLSAPSKSAQDAAHRLQERILANYRLMREVWVAIASDLYRMQAPELPKRERPYHALGFDTFEEWIDQQPFGRSWTYDLTAAYRRFVIDLAVPEERLARIEPSKVTEVLPAVRRNHVELDEALSDAETLSTSDLRRKYRELTKPTSSGRAPDTSTHYDAEAESALVRCYACNSLVPETQIQPPAVDTEHLFARTA